jgi:hypothetical protein
MEKTVSRDIIINTKSRHGVNPYFDTPMPKSMKGWQENGFYLRNNANAPLPAFTNNHPVPQPN